MARGFKRRRRGRSVTYAASLDFFERHLVVDLLRQVATLLDPEEVLGRADGRPRTDDFDCIVAGLGDLGLGDLGRADLPGEREGDGPGEGDASAHDPEDPALQRLFPSGNRDDEEAATEFRRLTEASLRDRKVTNLRSAADVLDAVPEREDALSLTPDQALTLLVALTDVRLVLASRLGLETDEDAERLHTLAVHAHPEDAVGQSAAIYDFLTWLQETLAGCLAP